MNYILKEIIKSLNGFSMNIIPAIIGAAGLLGSAYMSSKTSKENNNKSLWASANAHQIEKEDLIKAGMNPILTANGAGAPVPNFSNPDFSSLSQLGTVAGNAIERKIQKQNLQIQKDIAEADIENKKAEANEHQANANAINGYKAEESKTNTEKVKEDIDMIRKTTNDQIKKLKAEIKQIEATTKNTESNTTLTKKKVELFELVNYAKVAAEVGATVAGGYSLLKQSGKILKAVGRIKDIRKKKKILNKLGWKQLKNNPKEWVNTFTGEVKEMLFD